MVRGSSTNGMRILNPERARRWKRPRRSITMTSAWPMTLKDLVAIRIPRTTSIPSIVSPIIEPSFESKRIFKRILLKKPCSRESGPSEQSSRGLSEAGRNVRSPVAAHECPTPDVEPGQTGLSATGSASAPELRAKAEDHRGRCGVWRRNRQMPGESTVWDSRRSISEPACSYCARSTLTPFGLKAAIELLAPRRWRGEILGRTVFFSSNA